MAIFTPPNILELFSPRGQVLWMPVGSDREIVLSEFTNLTASPEYTEATFMSKSHEVSQEVASTVFAKALSLSGTAKSLNRRTLEILFGAGDGPNLLTQVAVVGGEKSYATPAVGDIFDLGSFDIEVDSVTDGAATPKTYDLGVHYTVDAPTGRVEVLAIPDGAATANIEIAYSAPAITAADKRHAFGIIGGNGARGQFTFRELGREGPFNWVATYWHVQIRVDGEIPHLGEDDYADIPMTIKVFARSGKPRGQEYGRVVVLDKA